MRLVHVGSLALVGLVVASGCEGSSNSQQLGASQLSTTASATTINVSARIETNNPGSTSSTSAQPPTTVGRPEEENSPVASLLDQFLLQGHTYAFILYEVDVEAQKCMKEFGWDYSVGPAVSPNAFTTRDVLAYRTVHGFGIADRIPRGDLVYKAPYPDFLSTLSSDAASKFLLDLEGPLGEGASYLPGEEQGCRPVAEAEITNGIPFFDTEFATVTADFVQRETSDPRYVEAMKAWGGCMSERGFAVMAREAVTAQLTEEYRSIAPSDSTKQAEFRQREIRTAVADFECYQHVNPSIRSVESDVLQAMVDEGLLPQDATGG